MNALYDHVESCQQTEEQTLQSWARHQNLDIQYISRRIEEYNWKKKSNLQKTPQPTPNPAENERRLWAFLE